ncbi:indolepyruvate ferredoxin oxidoreductase alpha subunit [Desulfonispora thiosulfatigenes DSM 11270]|uniref:Indolepyruvate oxidoreductase subunit IorA n=1 Tax=Desulfonispora thiosulfatigenes DSM 11270 TaxID=656914 RepID=A0A1W1UDL8_DESTI|nr:indolepyruvate ferredoxin oxidoreductase subunit alpha [Desulfonispora thiosulfatigenes]SMB79188.1 indolepyruvate ferredoxin oxidoreductase alpha subunit [Desulfonispora thiosulfatigenes DSM 11270]
MAQELLMGNEAIAMGAIRAGVGVVTGYPGTPSTEILETIAKKNNGKIYVEWSINEKAALEVAAGAAYAGMRTLVTMKQVGLNVASDPVMSLAYIGIKGGMVIVVADDPGPISSQTEQDTRQFGIFSKLPVFDPSSPEEAYLMIEDAFNYSEKYNTPVIFRPTTRVCHGCASIEVDDKKHEIQVEGFIKDPKWVIFPRLSYQNHLKIEARTPILSKDFSSYRFNSVVGSGKKGIATGGISFAYTSEALAKLEGESKLFKVSTPHPFPEKLALEFLTGLEEVLVIEELDPVIEKELVYLCGKYNLSVKIKGKLTGHMPQAGENTVEIVIKAVASYLDIALEKIDIQEGIPELPIRPPVLCAGCPHRASFYAVKQAMKGQKAVFSGDIGCYTLGNASPLNMVDTCLCMGAGITIAQGLHRAEPDAKNFAFIGDSTFFHSGIPGVVNAIYNETDIVLIVLDNSTTAMTGHQPHPGTGKTMMGNVSEKIDISKVLTALGVENVTTCDPLNLKEAISVVKGAATIKGVSAVIFKSPCIAVTKPSPLYVVDEDKCTGCKRCITELGCPAIVKLDSKVQIDSALCYGCSICAQVCPFDAIGGAK